MSSEKAVLDALAHPVRLDVLTYLASRGPATASACARAVGDTASNCSYHLRVLAQHNLVQPQKSTDGRERPWRATITSFNYDDPPPSTPEAASAAALSAASLQRDQRLARDYLARRSSASPQWREADSYASYTLKVTPAELQTLTRQLDELIRPFIAATRADAPAGAELAHVGLTAFPRNDWR
ncbi:MAG TPA: helix-turn-helix domain-containing protein [Jatrophihabitans sp.]|uniref:ArsR/SmtB family transcription factor n=1 Tax=Jatrophihabitans sp. TaxID=1932789 RepID=UPI002F13EE25